MTEAPPAATPAAKKPGSKMPIIIAVAVVVVAAGAGGGWMLHARSVKARADQGEHSDAPQKSEVKSVLHLESFIVNVQGGSGTSYLRIGIDLGLAGEAKEGEQSAPTGRLRDAILTVLGAQSVDALVTPASKEKLKADILKSVNDRLPEIECKEIYFTEFLVQQ
jgi:flagellar basal body-associated protein FliL